MASTLKTTVFLSLVLLCFRLTGQDTVSIYFELGKSFIPESQVTRLNEIPSRYDLSELDSVCYVGITDTVGNSRANLKLSKKRAQQAYKYCSRLFPKNYISRLAAMGEGSRGVESANRRVDIILYFKAFKTDDAAEVESGKSPTGCYYIDYNTLNKAHVRTVIKKGKAYTLVELSPNEWNRKNVLYSGSRGKNGELIPTKVKWANRPTGSLWWMNSRYTATIPQQDYANYKLFRIEDPPCNECSEELKTKPGTRNEDKCVQLDKFLMANLQVKLSFFRRNKLSIRVPKEYVDIHDKYFIGCNYSTRLIWETRKGKRKNKYYFTKLPVKNGYLGNIMREMTCCKYNPAASECDHGIIFCATHNAMSKSFEFIVEPGTYYQFSKAIPYISMGISKRTDYSQFMFLAGINNTRELYGSLRYDYTFTEFFFRNIRHLASWQSPGDVYIINHYGILYFGTELKSSYSNTNPILAEQNIHFGFAYLNSKEHAFFQKFFIQAGLGYDYSVKGNTDIYDVLQAGINFRLFKIGK